MTTVLKYLKTRMNYVRIRRHPLGRETHLDRDPPGQRPSWPESPLDRDPPGQRPPGQRSPWTDTPFGQRPPWTGTTPGQRRPGQRALCRQINTCEKAGNKQFHAKIPWKLCESLIDQFLLIVRHDLQILSGKFS